MSRAATPGPPAAAGGVPGDMVADLEDELRPLLAALDEVEAKPAPTPLDGFGSGPRTGGAAIAGQVASVASVRTAAQTGYDRFVIDLGQSPLQRYAVRTQPTSLFTLDPGAKR